MTYTPPFSVSYTGTLDSIAEFGYNCIRIKPEVILVNIRPSAAIRQNYNEIARLCQETGEPVEISCAIGDETVDGKPYAEIVETAREFIEKSGGFEKFAEWGLL